MAEHHVAAVIPDEAVRVAVAGGEPSDLVVALEELPPVVAQLGQSVGGAEAGWARAEDDDVVVHVNLVS